MNNSPKPCLGSVKVKEKNCPGNEGGKNGLKISVEVPGIEPGAFRMRSGRSTTELHPRFLVIVK